MIARRPVAGSLAEDDLLVVVPGVEYVKPVMQDMDGPLFLCGHGGGVACCVVDPQGWRGTYLM